MDQIKKEKEVQLKKQAALFGDDDYDYGEDEEEQEERYSIY